MFHPTRLYANRFDTALIWDGMTCAILTGCHPPAQDTAATPTDSQDTHSAVNTEMKTIAITAIVEHPALDTVRAGVIEPLAGVA